MNYIAMLLIIFVLIHIWSHLLSLFYFFYFYRCKRLKMADNVDEKVESTQKSVEIDKTLEDRIGCSHYARKCILIVCFKAHIMFNFLGSKKFA